MSVHTLAMVCIGLLAAGLLLVAVGLVRESLREKAASKDERPAKYRGVHRAGAVREPYQPPTWATTLPPSDALTEATQAMPLVELRGEIGRHGWHRPDIRSLTPRRAGVVAGWASWPTDEWQMREAEVWGEVAA